jgi:hypothetical protein
VLQSSRALACLAHQLLQNATHFPVGAATAEFVSDPSTDSSTVIIAVRQREIFILYLLGCTEAFTALESCSGKIALRGWSPMQRLSSRRLRWPESVAVGQEAARQNAYGPKSQRPVQSLVGLPHRQPLRRQRIRRLRVGHSTGHRRNGRSSAISEVLVPEASRRSPFGRRLLAQQLQQLGEIRRRPRLGLGKPL